jgi:ubiquinone/menaquinone biosynthesis C-methylase UbiE
MTTAKHPAKAPQRADQSEYVLGTGLDESTRLGLQHRLWSAAAHDLWLRARIQPGMKVLDIGSGPGHATLDLAQIVGPAGQVVAVDESAAFLKQLHDDVKARKLHNVERALGDVQKLADVLPGQSGVFDAAYARWVFCFLPRPDDLVAGLARKIKTGGRLLVQDYFNYEAMTLGPRREEMTTVVHAVAKSWRSEGGDPDIVARLPAMLRAHGFRIEHLGVHQRIAQPGSTMWHWPDSFFRIYVPKLVTKGFLTEAQSDAWFRCWDTASADPACFMVLPTVFDLIAVRE